MPGGQKWNVLPSHHPPSAQVSAGEGVVDCMPQIYPALHGIHEVAPGSEYVPGGHSVLKLAERKINRQLKEGVTDCKKESHSFRAHEPRHEKNGFLHMRKQRRISAAQ